MNRLPCVGIPVADGLIGATPFVVGEQFRKRLRDGRPGAVLLVPAAPRAKGRVDLRIVRSIEMKAAVSGGRVGDDAVRIDGRALRSAPRRVRAGADFPTPEGGALALVLGILMDAARKAASSVEFAAMTVEIGA